MTRASLTRLARILERLVLGLAVTALAFRLLVYGRIPKPAGAAFGNGDIIDFALGMAVFFAGGACAACGVALTAGASPEQRGEVWRPVLTGMTTFAVYYLVHPHVPVLR